MPTISILRDNHRLSFSPLKLTMPTAIHDELARELDILFVVAAGRCSCKRSFASWQSFATLSIGFSQ